MSQYLVFDIETCDADENSIQAAIAAWTPPANCKKEETIEQKRKEALERIRERAALLDASPVICIALASGNSHAIFHAMDNKIGPIDGWPLIGSPDEQTMLLLLRHHLNEITTPETRIVGQNVRAFDLPRLRQRYLHYRLKLPEILQPRMDDEPPLRVIDTMHLVKSFSMELRDERYISLNRIAQALDIDRPKQIISGADVPKLYAVGQYQEICCYCAIDCATTARAFLLMTGLAPDLA